MFYVVFFVLIYTYNLLFVLVSSFISYFYLVSFINFHLAFLQHLLVLKSLFSFLKMSSFYLHPWKIFSLVSRASQDGSYCLSAHWVYHFSFLASIVVVAKSSQSTWYLFEGNLSLYLVFLGIHYDMPRVYSYLRLYGFPEFLN